MNSTKRFGLTIAAIVRNEGPYLAEWIEYHQLIGFEHIYLYDNGSTDGTVDVLRDYIVQGRVTLLNWPDFPGQTSAYNHALKVFGRDSEWMALIDPDEFVQVDANQTLSEILARLGGADQVLLPWMHFDSAGHDDPPDGLVIESYTRRARNPHLQPKALVRPDAVLWAEVHHCITRHGLTVDPGGALLPERWILDRAPEGPIRLNHYFTKSRAEFAAKLSRGQVDGGRGKTMDAFTRHECPVQDASLARMGPAVRAAIHITGSRPKRPLVHAAHSAQSELSPSRAWTLRAQNVVKSLRSQLEPAVVIGSRTHIEWEQLILVAGFLPDVASTFASLREGMAERVFDALEIGAWQLADRACLGRPYLAMAGNCFQDAQMEVTVEGKDAGGKEFAAELALALPSGGSLTFAILSERTMSIARIRLDASASVADFRAEVCTFL